MNPVRSPGLQQGQASQKAPHLISNRWGRKFPLLGRQGLPEEGRDHLLPSATAQSLLQSPAKGFAWAEGLPLHSLTNICSAPTSCQSSPALKGQQPKHFPNVKSQLGGVIHRRRTGRIRTAPGQSTEEARGCLLWEKHQASLITETGPSNPGPSPHTMGGRRRKRRAVTFSPPYWLHAFRLTSATGHRVTPASPAYPFPPQGNCKQNQSTSLPPVFEAPQGLKDKGQPLQSTLP